MIQKWSSRPREARAARVRENQRRHRARGKAHVADLERDLADVRAQLDDALARNAQLTAELDLFRSGSAPEPPPENTSAGSVDKPSTPDPPPSVSVRYMEADETCSLTSTDAREILPLSPRLDEALEPESTGLPCPAPSACAGSCPVTAALITRQRVDGPADLAGVDLGDCPHLPPPAPGESTILCRTAFGIIDQQNYIGQDLGSIDQLLAPGFRRASSRGDGCRVESNRVFSVIDALSEPF